MKRRCRKVGNSNQLGKNWFPPRCSFCSFPIDGSPVFSIPLVSFFVFPVFFDVKKEQKIDQICPGGYLFRNISPSPPNCVYPRSRERESTYFFLIHWTNLRCPPCLNLDWNVFFSAQGRDFFRRLSRSSRLSAAFDHQSRPLLSALSLHPTFPAILVPLSHFP